MSLILSYFPYGASFLDEIQEHNKLLLEH